MKIFPLSYNIFLIEQTSSPPPPFPIPYTPVFCREIPFSMGGVKTEKGCFGRKKNSSWNLKILLGIRRLGKFFPGDMGDFEIKILESLRLWGKCLPKIWDNIPDFLEDFYSHMILPKQHLLGLSPLCIH